VLEARIVLVCAAALCRGVDAIAGEERLYVLIGRAEHLLAYSGWPGHQRGWINQHAARFFARLRRMLVAPAIGPQREPAVVPAGHPLRVGCYGRCSGLLGFPKELFEAFPREWSLHIYDVEFQGRLAGYLEPMAAEYRAVSGMSVPFAESNAAAAAAINLARLDLLLLIGYKAEVYDVADRVDTPCIAHMCTGIDLIHHAKVAFHICPQLQADYFMQDDALFCGTTHAPLPGSPVYEGVIVCDQRGIVPSANRWRSRENLIVFHGSLYKAASPDFLRHLYQLLQEDSGLEFVFMGRDSGGALELITGLAERAGVGGRVHYEGAYSSARDADGNLDDPGWQKVLGFLERARLAPDPWPVIGWSARFEAMLMGVPTVHLALRTDPASWGTRQPVVFDSPQLNVLNGTVTSTAGYVPLCRRCLYEEAFADRLAVDQQVVARRSVDLPGYWRQLSGFYDHWLETTGSAQHRDAGSRRATA
jgi:hypothetical protein